MNEMVENIVLKNTVTSAILELDKVTTPYYILDNVDWGQIKGTHHSYKYVNQIGVYVTRTSLGAREDVSITGWVIADSENQMTERKSMLNRFVNPQQMLEIQYKDYRLDFLPDSSIKYGTSFKENNEVMCKFKIEGMAPDPLFKDDHEDLSVAATTKGMFHFPLVINNVEKNPPSIVFGLREPSLIIDIYNHGAVSTGMKLVFKATATVVNPMFINVNTQEYFKINKTLVSGERVEINTNTGERKVVGILNGIESNYFKYRDLNSRFLQLDVGDNLFRYDAEENIDGLEVYVYFYNRYLEVQECY